MEGVLENAYEPFYSFRTRWQESRVPQKIWIRMPISALKGVDLRPSGNASLGGSIGGHTTDLLKVDLNQFYQSI